MTTLLLPIGISPIYSCQDCHRCRQIVPPPLRASIITRPRSRLHHATSFGLADVIYTTPFQDEIPPTRTCSKTMPLRGRTTPKVLPSYDPRDLDMGFPPEHVCGIGDSHQRRLEQGNDAHERHHCQPRPNRALPPKYATSQAAVGERATSMLRRSSTLKKSTSRVRPPPPEEPPTRDTSDVVALVTPHCSARREPSGTPALSTPGFFKSRCLLCRTSQSQE
jgi:hypothetical protein